VGIPYSGYIEWNPPTFTYSSVLSSVTRSIGVPEQ
jgi:hypothetical protein